jgi:DNA ligase (NAD+)
MTRDETKKRIEKLKKAINYHRYLYHVLDRQEISESTLDSLKKELFDLEQRFPELITSDSPTQRIGSQPLEKFQKASHPEPMLSFNDAFSEKDMEDWLERISRILAPEEISRIDFYCELKIDGLAAELTYKDKILKIGSTRGDGRVGEDVTQNLKTIEAIPLFLREKSEVLKGLEREGLDKIAKNIEKRGLREIIVRGEVFVSKKELEKINKEQEKRGLPTFANTRNIAAGSIRQLDSKITATRGLDFFAYDIITDFGQETHQEEHQILKILGFKTNFHNKFCQNLKEVFEFYRFCQKRRERLFYEIDGLVIRVNNNKIFKKLGVAGKAPRGAIAFKFPLKHTTTQIEDIIVQVGRTGALTPVALLKPVKIGGVKVSRATLHNEDEIKRLGVQIGDTVIVGRAGDVIPEVVKSLPELRTGKEKNFKFPKICPACHSRVIKPEEEAIWRCENPKCFAKKREYFYHFVSKSAFDIEGLGPRIVDKLIDAGLVSDPADLFKLEIEDILPLESLGGSRAEASLPPLSCQPRSFRGRGGVLRGFAEKSAENLVRAIQQAKTISLSRFIFALGIRNVGEQTAIDLTEHFGSLEKLKNASLKELESISDIGPIVAQSIRDWFTNKENLSFLEKFSEVGVKVKPARYEIKTLKLRGKTFVLTGTLESMTREEARAKIRELGGKVSSSVSKNIDFVVFGKNPGSKLTKAKKLGLKIISEPTLLQKMFEAGF